MTPGDIARVRTELETQGRARFDVAVAVTDANDPNATFVDGGASLAFDPVTGQLTGTPGVQDQVTLPDGTSRDLTLTATASGTPPSSRCCSPSRTRRWSLAGCPG